MADKKIQATKNYRLFARSSDNRKLDIKKHKKLLESMRRYGFLKCFPIVARRNEDGNLIVKDGQHRLAIAELLELTVYWIDEEVDFDVAVINCTSKIWGLRDFAEKHAANGLKAYQEGIDFAEKHKLPIGTTFALLAGYTAFTNCQEDFVAGTFKVKDRQWADAVAGIYVSLTSMSDHLKNARFIEACMAICRVPEFDQKRLTANAERCREKLVPYSTRDAYLDMLEAVYNFGRVKLFGLKVAAMMVMRERNAVSLRKKAAKEKREKVEMAAV